MSASLAVRAASAAVVPTLKLWLIEPKGKWGGYDVYSSAVVAAATEEDACNTHPSRNHVPEEDGFSGGEWPPPQWVKATLIGEAAPGVGVGPVCASFHAG